MLRPPSVASAFSIRLTPTCSLLSCQRLHALHTDDSKHHNETSFQPRRRRRHPRIDHTPYIDPSSLKQSLENVRDANRARLIRKVYQGGRTEAIELPRPATFPAGQDQAEHDTPQTIFHPSRSVSVKTSRNQYVGNARSLKKEWQLNDSFPLHLTHPWLNFVPLPSKATSVEEALTSEIEAFGAYMASTAREEAAAEGAIVDIKNAVHSVEPRVNLELIGSRNSGLAMPLSDLDFNVVPPEGRLDDILDRYQAMMNLRKLRLQLKRNKKLWNMILIKRAKIPIIRGTHNPTGLEFQIQHTSNAYNSTQYVKIFLNEYPTLRNLFLVLRHMLTMVGLSDGSRQGLSSYPLVNMILASLKFDEQDSRPTDAGNQLLSFLKMYSTIDFDSFGLSVTPLKLLPKFKGQHEGSRSQRQSVEDTEFAPHNSGFPYAMYLRDPADPSNDLGRSCALIRQVQLAFLSALRDLEKAMGEWGPDNKGQPQKPLLQFLVGDFTTFEVDRVSLRRSLPKSTSLRDATVVENRDTVPEKGKFDLPLQIVN